MPTHTVTFTCTDHNSGRTGRNSSGILYVDILENRPPVFTSASTYIYVVKISSATYLYRYYRRLLGSYFLIILLKDLGLVFFQFHHSKILTNLLSDDCEIYVIKPSVYQFEYLHIFMMSSSRGEVYANDTSTQRYINTKKTQ